MHRFPITTACAVILLVVGCGPAGEGPDRIFHNALIWTGDSANAEAQALAITGDRIVAIGSDEAVRALRGRNTRMEDLGGRRVVLGFHDAHMHFPARRTADLTDAAGPEAIVERLRTFAADLPADTWLTGRGWTPVAFPSQRNRAPSHERGSPDPTGSVRSGGTEGRTGRPRVVALSPGAPGAPVRAPAMAPTRPLQLLRSRPPAPASKARR